MEGEIFSLTTSTTDKPTPEVSERSDLHLAATVIFWRHLSSGTDRLALTVSQSSQSYRFTVPMSRGGTRPTKKK